MQVELASKTIGCGKYADRSIDELLVGEARISAGKVGDELFATPVRLIKHCLINGHWSVFDLASLGFEYVTSRAMARDLMRHWSIKRQEYSQRYAIVPGLEPIQLRGQATNNRQSSTTELSLPSIEMRVADHLAATQELYAEMLEAGVARECARMMLPETASTTVIMHGTVREWITMLNVRLHKTTQLEARSIAVEISKLFTNECPLIAASLFNFHAAEEIPILDQLILEKYDCRNLVLGSLNNP